MLHPDIRRILQKPFCRLPQGRCGCCIEPRERCYKGLRVAFRKEGVDAALAVMAAEGNVTLSRLPQGRCGCCTGHIGL